MHVYIYIYVRTVSNLGELKRVRSASPNEGGFFQKGVGVLGIKPLNLRRPSNKKDKASYL